MYIQFACRTVACQFSFELLLSLLFICGRCWCSIVVSSTGAGHLVLTGSLCHTCPIYTNRYQSSRNPHQWRPPPMEASTNGSIGKNRHLSKKPYDLYHWYEWTAPQSNCTPVVNCISLLLASLHKQFVDWCHCFKSIPLEK